MEDKEITLDNLINECTDVLSFLLTEELDTLFRLSLTPENERELYYLWDQVDKTVKMFFKGYATKELRSFAVNVTYYNIVGKLKM